MIRGARRTVVQGGTGLALALFVATQGAQAQTIEYSDYQNFFAATVCGAGAGNSTYIIRCQQTKDPTKPDSDPTAYADISSRSESSLTPGQVLAAASNSMRSAQAAARQTEERLQGLRNEDDGTPGGPTDKIAGFGPWSIFLSVDGEWFDQSRPLFSSERGFDGSRTRGTAGASYRVQENTHIGLALSYDRYSSTFDTEPTGTNAVGSAFVPQTNSGGRKADTWTLTAFAGTDLGSDVWVDAAAGLAWSDNDFRRNATYQANRNANALAVQALGSADGRQVFASLGLGYDGNSGALSFGPYVRLRYVHSEVDGYSETDQTSSYLTYVVSKQKATSLTGTLGLRSSYAMSTSWGVVVPQVRAEFEHEFKDDARSLDIRFAAQPTSNSSTLVITSDAPDRDHANLGLGLLFVLPGGVMPFVDYEALAGYSGYSRHRATIGLRLEF